MRCYICDVAIETPQFNADHNDYDPCETCKAVIADTVGAVTDHGSAFSPGGLFDTEYLELPEDLNIPPREERG